jgi:hypothetical protein
VTAHAFSSIHLVTAAEMMQNDRRSGKIHRSKG